MPGTILILDPVSTNRIMLKVQLSAAWYHVVQADGLSGLPDLVRRTPPDLIVTAMTLPDGSALDLRASLAVNPALAGIPVIAITPQNDREARLKALAGGIDEVLAWPLDDVLLQARIRSLIRARSPADELQIRGTNARFAGLAEQAAQFAGLTSPPAPVKPAQVAMVTTQLATNFLWRSRLGLLARHQISGFQMGDVQELMGAMVPDAIVLELGTGDEGAGLRLLADLRARSSTRHAPIIAVPNPANTHLAAEALDRGAHDVLQGGFCADELALRLATQLRRKARADGMRKNLSEGLRASVLDPMTGLYNRRYALPQLANIARTAARNGQSFAVMLADLDHFKRVNDRYGHPVGDAVLVETARRLRATLRPPDMIARIGGEEFLIVLADTSHEGAKRAADRLCRQINATPFDIPGIATPIEVTTSIGVVVAAPSACALSPLPGSTGDKIGAALIGQADQALYEAKDAGRNQFTLIRPAA